MRRDLLFIGGWRGYPDRASLGLASDALFQLRNVARGLFMMNERLRGLWALGPRVICTKKEEDPIRLDLGDIRKSDQPMSCRLSPDRADRHRNIVGRAASREPLPQNPRP